VTLPTRKRVRLQGFDYSNPGCYFVTINARTQEPWFGSVDDGLLRPNAAGGMVLEIWLDLPAQFPGVHADMAVVMPDHLHGIIMLGTDPEIPASLTLSAVIGAFKSRTTVEYGRGVRSEGWRPYDQQLWHRSFRDTIVRSDRALEAFRDYIEGNPGRWAEKRGQ